MALNKESLYAVHVEHLRSIRRSFDKTHRQLRRSVAEQDEGTAFALLRLSTLLMGIWAEVRLQKLLYEDGGLNDHDRALVERTASQTNKWLKAVELGFRRQFSLPNADLASHLPISVRGLYTEIVRMIDEDLRPLIETRNDLAHGRWINPLTGSGNVSHVRKSRLDAENALTVKFKLSILDNLGRIIHDLICSPAAFVRDIDKHYTMIENAKRNLENRSYDRWRNHQVAKLQNGRDRQER